MHAGKKLMKSYYDWTNDSVHMPQPPDPNLAAGVRVCESYVTGASSWLASRG